jgi:hypothetical protein
MKIKGLTPSRQKIAKARNGVCPICGESFATKRNYTFITKSKRVKVATIAMTI